MRQKRWLDFRLLLITGPIITILVFTACSRSFASNGERIYFTATSDSGEPITYTEGPRMMMPGNFSCVNCHGPEGKGGVIHIMMGTYDVPDITWPELTGPHMEHPPFTEETLKQAITLGIDPGGNPLEYPMPRWKMSTQDLNDLAAYIMSLK